MKKCPYCAEEIQDEAIKCRYCLSDLTTAPQTGGSAATGTSGASGASPTSAVSAPSSGTTMQEGAAASDAAASTTRDDETTSDANGETSNPAPAEAPSSTWGAGGTSSTWGTPSSSTQATSGVAQKYTHSGYRYVLGYGADFFGIWNRDNPSTPTERYPRTDQGWRDAYTKFAQLEPNNSAVPDTGGATPEAAGTTAMSSGGVAPQIEMNPGDTAALQYTHSGSRYLLGYGQTFFGIWDRQSPTTPVERFPRSDEGWAQAWRRYTQIETNFTEVR